MTRTDLIYVLYIVAFSLFISGLKATMYRT